MNVTPEMFAKWCDAYKIDTTDESQVAGIEGSLTMIAEGQGEVPEWMEKDPIFESVLLARSAHLQSTPPAE